MMMVSLRSRPSWERSYEPCKQVYLRSLTNWPANLDIVALVVEATLSEQSVVDDVVDVELVQKRIAVLISELAYKYD
jgi:hypothetical protein